MLKNIYVDVENSGEYVKFAADTPEGEISLWWDGAEFYNESRVLDDGCYADVINRTLEDSGVPAEWQGHSRRVKVPRDPSVGLVPTDWNE